MKLTKLENAWADAALGAIFPGSRDEGLADIGGMDVRGFLDEVMRCIPWKAAFGMRVAIWLVALAPLFVLGRWATIARLAPVERERLVGALVASRAYAIRSLVLILKTVGALLYAADDRVRARMLTPAAPGSLVTLRVDRPPARAAVAG